MPALFEIDGNPIGLIVRGGPLAMTLDEVSAPDAGDDRPEIEMVEFGASVDPDTSEDPAPSTEDDTPVEDFAPVETPFDLRPETLEALVEAFATPDESEEHLSAPATLSTNGRLPEATGFTTLDTGAFRPESAPAVAWDDMRSSFAPGGREAIGDLAPTDLF